MYLGVGFPPYSPACVPTMQDIYKNVTCSECDEMLHYIDANFNYCFCPVMNKLHAAVAIPKVKDLVVGIPPIHRHARR